MLTERAAGNRWSRGSGRHNWHGRRNSLQFRSSRRSEGRIDFSEDLSDDRTDLAKKHPLLPVDRQLSFIIYYVSYWSPLPCTIKGFLGRYGSSSQWNRAPSFLSIVIISKKYLQPVLAVLLIKYLQEAAPDENST